MSAKAHNVVVVDGPGEEVGEIIQSNLHLSAAEHLGEGHGNEADPDKAAVKDESYQGLSAGAEGEIGGVGVGIEGHHDGVDAD